MNADSETIMTRSRQKCVAEKYQRSRAMTAGKISTVLLLIEKARQLIIQIKPDFGGAPQPELAQCQNIIAQLEMGLNFKRGKAAPDLFRVYELIYNGLQSHTQESLTVARYLLDHLRDTIKLRFRR